MNIFIGCAGWQLRKEFAELFPAAGTHLERYSGVFNAVEINSSFYRSHRVKTYQRWADSTPSHFRFAIKLPKQITHVDRLINPDPQIVQFLAETSGLGEKRGPILVQLPPSLAFDASTVRPFFHGLRARLDSAIVCEPRHPSWFSPEADELMQGYRIARVAADPAVMPEASDPGGCQRDCFFRWHGSPRMYYSAYDEHRLTALADRLLVAAAKASSVWCIFDNTAEGAALKNALELSDMTKASAPVETLA